MTEQTQVTILWAAVVAILVLFFVAASLYNSHLDKKQLDRSERDVGLCLNGSSSVEDIKYCCSRYSPGFDKAPQCQGTFITRPDGSVIFVQ